MSRGEVYVRQHDLHPTSATKALLSTCDINNDTYEPSTVEPRYLDGART